jgi:hypothetical protein
VGKVRLLIEVLVRRRAEASSPLSALNVARLPSTVNGSSEIIDDVLAMFASLVE